MPLYSACAGPTLSHASPRTSVQVRQYLFQVNRVSSKVQWNLNRVEYATRHLVQGINGGPSHYETRWNVKYSVDITLEGGPAALPAAAGTPAFGVHMPAGALGERLVLGVFCNILPLPPCMGRG